MRHSHIYNILLLPITIYRNFCCYCCSCFCCHHKPVVWTWHVRNKFSLPMQFQNLSWRLMATKPFYGYLVFFLVVNTNKSIILIVAIAKKERDPKGCQKNSYKVCPFLYKTIGKNSKILPWIKKKLIIDTDFSYNTHY